MSSIATTRILHYEDESRMSGRLQRWIWPLPRLDGLAPRILASTRDVAPEDVELGYQGRAWSLVLVPVFAAREGIVTYAGTGAHGRTVCIDHAGGWSTQYAGLGHVLTRPTDRFRKRRKERVHAGDVIGYAPRSPLRIRFSLSRWSDDACATVDPDTCMHAWSALPWFADPPRQIAASATI
jgi:hypothetical protein